MDILVSLLLLVFGAYVAYRINAGLHYHWNWAAIPQYLYDVYYWAYLSPLGVALLDHPFVVWTILWGNFARLMNLAFAELEEGQSVLQPASEWPLAPPACTEADAEPGHGTAA